MRTNARAVCLVSVLALAGVIAFWVWMLSSPIENIAMLPSSSRGRAEAKGGLAVLSYIEAMRLCDVRPERNPFVSGFRPENPPPNQRAAPEMTIVPVKVPTVAPEVKPPPEVARPALAVAAPGADVSAPAVAAPGPVSRSVSLTYRGMYRRSDGRLMVLVEDSESGGSSFYGVDGRVLGMRIGTVAAETMELMRDGGRAETLRRGETAVFNGIRDE
jgi:hypothetical protein